MSRELFHNILKQYWGYDSFRPLQLDIIESVWNSKDTLGLMPTGGGKSLTFQVPALGMEGICLVITPLIALMKDQVDNLKDQGIKAAAIYSGMSRNEIIATLENCIFGDYKFLYVSPERLGSDLFQAKLQAMNVSLLVVDEAHCISQWGYDFRPAYLQIAEVRNSLPHVPVLALTATATHAVIKDIQTKLQFKQKNLFRMSFERKNLSYVVRHAENKTTHLIHILKSVPGTAIVYVRSRRKTKEIAVELQQAGFSADYYHAGLSNEEKILKQNKWKDDECRIIVSTNAFGMGIDKPDVRLVIHTDLPNSLEEYYQEAGRAGRDGERSYATILYSEEDTHKMRKRISDSFPKKKFIKRVYQALGNYYQVAVGSGYNAIYDFNLYDFCRAYEFPFLQTHHALQILELSGYIEYTEEVDSRSRARILVDRNEMYNLNISKANEELIFAMLRNYTGLFIEDVYIDEGMLASIVNKTRDEVYQLLTQLAKTRYISYIPQKKTPFIIFTTSREDIQHVSIPRSAYEDRHARFKSRISSMIDYVEKNDICRSRMLLIYFDEKNPTDCGECDVCRKKTKTGLNNYEYLKIKKAIFEALKDKEELPLDTLIESLQEFEEENIHKVISFLIDQKKITSSGMYNLSLIQK